MSEETLLTTALVKWPLNISFGGLGRLEPTEDITPREAVLLVMLITCMGSGAFNVDYIGFVKDNKLERHFRE